MKKVFLIIPFLLFAAQIISTYKYSEAPEDATYLTPSNDSLFGGVFLRENIKEGISTKDYINYKSIFAHKKNRIDFKNESRLNSSSSFSVGNFGMNEFKSFTKENIINHEERELLASKDSSFFKPELEKIHSCLSNLEAKNIYYFSFGEFKIKNNEKKYFVLNDIGYLAMPKLVKNDTMNMGKQITYEYERKELKIKYDPSIKRILIPLSATSKNLISVLIYILGFLLLVFSLSIYFYFPYRIIKNISIGKPFAEQNIVELKFIFKYTVALTLLFHLFPFVLNYCLQYWIPNDFTLITSDRIFLNLLESYCYCLVIYSIYKAFKKGYDLQQENELTV